MKRSSMLSTVALTGLAVAMAGSFAVGVRATQKEHKSCLNGCGPKQTPKADGCCKPPPCEFFYDLKTTKAYERLVSNTGLMKALQATFHTTYKTATEFNAFVKDAMKKASKKFGGCPAETAYKEHPFEVNQSSCSIGFNVPGGFVETSLDNEIANGTACEERVRAEYKRAESLQAWCKAQKREPDFPVTSAEFQREFQKAEKAKVDSLEKQFNQFMESCKGTEGADTAQFVLKMALDELNKVVPPPKGAPKRTAGRGGR